MTDVVQQLLIQSWAVVDPAAVIDKIEQVPYHLQPLACEQALGELARTDPERSIALIQTLKHLGAGKHRALRGVVKKWSETRPKRCPYLGSVSTRFRSRDSRRFGRNRSVFSSLRRPRRGL